MKITIKEYIDKYPERLGKNGIINIFFSADEYRNNDIVFDCSDCPDNIDRLCFRDESAYGIDKYHKVINVNNKGIALFASNFNWILGNNNEISISDIHSPYLKISGYDNTIYHCSDSNLDVIGSRNKVDIPSISVGEFMGNDNTILCWNRGGIYIPQEFSKNNTVVIGGYSQCFNGDPSTKIYCFNNTICRTIEGANNIKSYENSKVFTYAPYLNPREECKEPIDEEYGYFYKVVGNNLGSVLYEGIYTVGEWAYPDSFSENDKVCDHGIHFFATKEQAVFFSDRKLNYKILKLKVRFDDIAITGNYDNDTHKMRARKVFVESIVPEEEYAELGGILTSANF